MNEPREAPSFSTGDSYANTYRVTRGQTRTGGPTEEHLLDLRLRRQPALEHLRRLLRVPGRGQVLHSSYACNMI